MELREKAEQEPAGESPTHSGDASPAQPATKLFLGGLSWQTTEGTLRQYFGRFGAIADAVVMHDRATRQPRGFGFVRFAEASAARKAIEHGLHWIDDRTVECKPSIPVGQQPPGATSRARKVFVGGLSPATSEEEFRAYFAQFGSVAEAQIMVDATTNRPRGFGFVTYEDEDSVHRVFAAGPMHELSGKVVEVKAATPKGSGPQGPSNASLQAGAYRPSGSSTLSSSSSSQHPYPYHPGTPYVAMLPHHAMPPSPSPMHPHTHPYHPCMATHTRAGPGVAWDAAAAPPGQQEGAQDSTDPSPHPSPGGATAKAHGAAAHAQQQQQQQQQQGRGGSRGGGMPAPHSSAVGASPGQGYAMYSPGRPGGYSPVVYMVSGYGYPGYTMPGPYAYMPYPPPGAGAAAGHLSVPAHAMVAMQGGSCLPASPGTAVPFGSPAGGSSAAATPHGSFPSTPPPHYGPSSHHHHHAPPSHQQAPYYPYLHQQHPLHAQAGTPPATHMPAPGRPARPTTTAATAHLGLAWPWGSQSSSSSLQQQGTPQQQLAYMLNTTGASSGGPKDPHARGSGTGAGAVQACTPDATTATSTAAAVAGVLATLPSVTGGGSSAGGGRGNGQGNGGGGGAGRVVSAAVA